MKSLVIAEKPSVGRDIARVLGCKQGGNGCLEGRDYVVTWALGHLIELSDPESYGEQWKVWKMETLPMLPEKLSNGLCSLNEGCDRLALCAVIDLDEHGNRKGLKLCEGVIRSSARLTYAGVQALLDGDARLRERYASLVPMLELMGELAKKRIKLRRERGTIDFKLTETQIKFDADGRVTDIEKRPSFF